MVGNFVSSHYLGFHAVVANTSFSSHKRKSVGRSNECRVKNYIPPFPLISSSANHLQLNFLRVPAKSPYQS